MIDFHDDEEDDYERLYKLDRLWGFSYSGLDGDFYYWEIVRFSRKFIMAILTMLGDPIEQVCVPPLPFRLGAPVAWRATPSPPRKVRVGVFALSAPTM